MTILSFRLNENLYLRDPQSSQLGQRIIQHSVELIFKIGFENFTFRKLADVIGSTEASVYRYFENKHRLLLYLIDWYWTWIDYKIDFAMQNLPNPEDRLRACIRVLVEGKTIEPGLALMDEHALRGIVIAEFDKTYLTKQVDTDNREGLFFPYKSVCRKISMIISEINCSYQFSNSLASTVLLTINHQKFYARHLPSLTDIGGRKRTDTNQLYRFCESIIFSAIRA